VDISFQVLVHTIIGLAAVSSGVMAIILRKGSPLHKLFGRVFVGVILLMVPIVVTSAWLSLGSISPLGILFVFFIAYLVVSAWPKKYRPKHALRWFDFTKPMLGLCISISGFVMGIKATSNPIGSEGLPPTGAYFFFAGLAFIAMFLDLNNVIRGGVRGKHRIVRHVWRMNCALFFFSIDTFYWAWSHRTS
jgi:hypothetical protein